MAINVRYDGDVVVLSNFARLMNDPKYMDAGRDVKALLDEGHRRFVLELAAIRDTGSVLVGLLLTLTRLIRQRGGDAVLADVSEALDDHLLMMQLDTYWDTFPTVGEAKAHYAGRRP